MDFIDKLKSDVKEDNTEETKYYALLSDIKNIKDMPKEHQKQTLLNIMSFTGTWIGLYDLQKMLANEDFSKIEQIIVAETRKRYEKALEEQPEKRDEVEQEIIPQDLKETFFAIITDGQTYLLKDAPYGIRTYSINLGKINIEEFRNVVGVSVEKHLSNGTFYDRGKIKAEWIKSTLENAAKQLQPKEEVSIDAQFE